MRDSVQQVTTRDAILDAADRLLARYGYRKMTIDDLAHEVSIGKGSIYLHFPSKEEIVLCTIDRIIERLKSNLRKIAAERVTSEVRLHRMLVERVLFRFDSVQHYTQSLNDLLSHIRRNLLERRKRYFDEEARIFAQVIKEGKTQGDLVSPDPVVTAHTLLMATNSLLPYSLSTYELGNRKEIERSAKRLADVLLQGIVRR